MKAQSRADGGPGDVLINQVVERLVVGEYQWSVSRHRVRICRYSFILAGVSLLEAALSIRASISGFEYPVVLIGPPDLITSE